MELLKIVDENGIFTGQILEREEVHRLKLLHRIVGIFIVNAQQQFLLGKISSQKKNNSNKWGLIAGHVIGNENLVTTALRELKEELGLDVSVHELIMMSERELVSTHIMYFCVLKTNLNLAQINYDSAEMANLKWFDIAEINDLVHEHNDQITFGEQRLSLVKKIKEL